MASMGSTASSSDAPLVGVGPKKRFDVERYSFPWSDGGRLCDDGFLMEEQTPLH